MHRFEPDARPARAVRPARARHGRARRALRALRERARRGRHRRLRRRSARPRRATARAPRTLGHFADATAGRRSSPISARSACASASSTAACRGSLLSPAWGSFIALECLTRFGDAYRAGRDLRAPSSSAGPRAWVFREARHASSASGSVCAARARCSSAACSDSSTLPFEPAATSFDWLCAIRRRSRSTSPDPLCGFVTRRPEPGGTRVAHCLEDSTRRTTSGRIPRGLPLAPIAGAARSRRRDAPASAAQRRGAARGRTHTRSRRLYPDARHEL